MPILPPTTMASPPAIVRPADSAVTAEVADVNNAADAIVPCKLWADNNGRPIEAHGGGVILVDGTYYWFGEDYTPTNRPGTRCVGCYASTDLTHWTFRRQAVVAEAPEGFDRRWILERPKVYPNRATGQFVMYAHVDDGRYRVARVGVFVSSTIDGPYRFVRAFRPLGKESRDIGQFIDDDGAAYLIFESRPTGGFFVARLSDDYLDVARQTCFIHAPLEGGAMAHVGGKYIVVGSHMSGWSPNPNVYATADRIEGPWTTFNDLAPPKTKTYLSQSTFLLRIVGAEQTTVIFMADQWRPNSLDRSRYLWMPLEIAGDRVRLPAPKPWRIDLKTGIVRWPDASATTIQGDTTNRDQTKNLDTR